MECDFCGYCDKAIPAGQAFCDETCRAEHEIESYDDRNDGKPLVPAYCWGEPEEWDAGSL